MHTAIPIVRYRG